MHGKTEPTRDFSGREELSAPFRFWLYTLTVITLLLVMFTDFESFQALRSTEKLGFHITLMPWIEATRIMLSNGLDVFSGLPVSPPTDAQRMTMLTGMLLSLVVGPTLFLLGLRVYRKRAGTGGSRSYGLMLSLILGGILVYTVALPSVPVAVLQWRVSASLREAQEMGDQRDRLIGSLAAITRKAREFRVLPVQFGGGAGSFNGYTLTEGAEKDEAGTYRVESSSDSVLVIRATPFSSRGQSVVATLERSGTLRYRFEDMTKN